jgi:phospholipid/cholesterol/gamma-HCH transport system ATP-binding protein
MVLVKRATLEECEAAAAKRRRAAAAYRPTRVRLLLIAQTPPEELDRYSLSVYENVAYGLRERKNWSEERIDRVTRDALRMVGLHDHAERMPEDFSGGEAKRTALARALALESGIFIVDDLDAGLDDVRLALLCEIIRETREDTDATVLVTTHDMKVAADLADYVAVIHEGRSSLAETPIPCSGCEEPFVRQFVSGASSGPLQLRDT